MQVTTHRAYLWPVAVNALYITITYKGFPYVFLLALNDIKKGEQVREGSSRAGGCLRVDGWAGAGGCVWGELLFWLAQDLTTSQRCGCHQLRVIMPKDNANFYHRKSCDLRIPGLVKMLTTAAGRVPLTEHVDWDQQLCAVRADSRPCTSSGSSSSSRSEGRGGSHEESTARGPPAVLGAHSSAIRACLCKDA